MSNPEFAIQFGSLNVVMQNFAEIVAYICILLINVFLIRRIIKNPKTIVKSVCMVVIYNVLLLGWLSPNQKQTSPSIIIKVTQTEPA